MDLDDANDNDYIFNDNNDCTRENCGTNPSNITYNINPAISVSYIKFLFVNLINIIDYGNNIYNNHFYNNITLLNRINDVINHLAEIPTGIFANRSVLLPQQYPYYFQVCLNFALNLYVKFYD